MDGASLAGGTETEVTYKYCNGTGVTLKPVSWSWKDANGKEHEGAKLPDPVGCVAVSGGLEGVTFLGQSIPAGKWGYFYQVYNNGSAPIERATFQNRAPMAPTEFVLLPEAYPPAYIDQFDDAYDDEGLEAFDFMAEENATSTGTTLASWSYDGELGHAVAAFQSPLQNGETSSLFGFISDCGPHDRLYDVNETVQLYGADDAPVCPKAQNGLVPTFGEAPPVIPTVSAWGLVVLTASLLVGWKVVFSRRRSAAA